MGINELDLAVLTRLDGFTSVTAVCDLGDQDYICWEEEKFRAFNFPANVPIKGKSSEFWKALGMRHISLDLVGDSYRFDLNTQSVPFWWRKFDLVTNCGNSEHVMDQFNCFKVIHDLTKVGGIMYHQLPVAGFATHGFWRYNPLFFRALMNANGYELLANVLLTADRTNDGDPGPDVPHNLDRWRAQYRAPDAIVRIAFRKKKSDRFRPALDVP